MDGMGERTGYATSRCTQCTAPIVATGYNRNRVDITTREEFARGEKSTLPGLVEWAAWRHAAPFNMDTVIHPVDPDHSMIKLTDAGRRVTSGPYPGTERFADVSPRDEAKSDCCSDCVNRCDGYCTLCHGTANVTEPVPEPEPLVHRYPHTVKWSDVKAFLQVIGVDPIDEQSMNLVKIAPDGVTFKRFREMPGDEATSTKYVTAIRRRSGSSERYGYGDVAEQITTARIDWSA